MAIEPVESANESDPYSGGLLWLPIVGVVDDKFVTKKSPLMNQGSLSTMTPFVSLNFENIWNKQISYENIVDFEYDILTGSATLTIIDITPAFIEAVIRQLYNNVRETINSDKNTPPALKLRFGWYIGIAGKGLGNSKTYTSDLCEFYILNAGYKHSSFGIIITLQMVFMSNALTKSKQILPEDYFQASFQNLTDPNPERAKLVLQSVLDRSCAKLGIPSFNVNIRGSKMKWDYEAAKVTFSKDLGNITLYDGIELFRKCLYVPVDKKAASKPSGGKIDTFYGHTLKNKKYDLVFYEVDQTTQELVPLVTYPARESPVVGWNPNLSAGAEFMYLYNTVYKQVDAAGNEISASATAPVGGSNKGESISISGDNMIRNVQAQSPLVVTLDLTILGDPLLTPVETIFRRWRVKNSSILQPGSVKTPSNYISSANFPTITGNIDSKTLKEAADNSPFTGEYIVHAIKHKISKANGYTTSITLWKVFDDIQDTSIPPEQ